MKCRFECTRNISSSFNFLNNAEKKILIFFNFKIIKNSSSVIKPNYGKIALKLNYSSLKYVIL